MKPDFTRTLSDGRAGFPAVLDDLESYLDSLGAPPSAIGPVLIALDEVVSNILDYGGDDPRVEIAVTVGGGRVAVEIVDNGAAFNPMAQATPDTNLSVEDRAIGGLGIHLVRKLMDAVGYDRRDGLNRLHFSKTYSSASS